MTVTEAVQNPFCECRYMDEYIERKEVKDKTVQVVYSLPQLGDRHTDRVRKESLVRCTLDYNQKVP